MEPSDRSRTLYEAMSVQLCEEWLTLMTWYNQCIRMRQWATLYKFTDAAMHSVIFTMFIFHIFLKQKCSSLCILYSKLTSQSAAENCEISWIIIQVWCHIHAVKTDVSQLKRFHLRVTFTLKKQQRLMKLSRKALHLSVIIWSLTWCFKKRITGKCLTLEGTLPALGYEMKTKE